LKPSPVDRTRRIIRRAAPIAASLLALSSLPAQRSVPAPDPMSAVVRSDSLRLYLVTMGQGDAVWELFGHNAIWVHDPAMSFDVIYNWGVFAFDEPGFIGRFLLGDMRYKMIGQYLEPTIAEYRKANRQVWAQELDLTQSEKRALIDYMRWHALPENATYRYDYYLDNCSTRVRDAIDRVVGGAVRSHLRSIPTDATYRSHSLRLMQGEKLLVSGVQVALGRPTDALLNADQASFLPVQLMQHLRGVRLDGGTRPLLGREFVLHAATRPPEPNVAPRLWKGFLPIGLGLAAAVLLLAFGRRGAEPTGSRKLATAIAIIAGFIGTIGTILAFLVTATDHVAAHWNENMFLFNPLWLALAIVAPLLIVRRRAGKPSRWLAVAAASLAVLGVLVHLVGLSRQPNWDVIALALPIELAIATVIVTASRFALPRD
jgi:hypothetical protein